MKLVNFKCPNCGSGIGADTDSRTVTCEYCGSTFAIDDESLTVNVNLSGQEEAGISSKRVANVRKRKQNPLPLPSSKHRPKRNVRLGYGRWAGFLFFRFPSPS